MKGGMNLGYGFSNWGFEGLLMLDTGFVLKFCKFDFG